MARNLKLGVAGLQPVEEYGWFAKLASRLGTFLNGFRTILRGRQRDPHLVEFRGSRVQGLEMRMRHPKL